jgi:hypothetical protein
MDAHGATPSGRDMTSQPLYTVRPEPRRAYNQVDEIVAAQRKSEAEESKRLLMLQQAANYASLAIQPHTSRVDSGSIASIVAPPPHAIEGVKRRLSRGPFRNLSTRKKDGVASLQLYTPQGGGAYYRHNDVEGEDAPPRLSISSAESSGGSEVKTPESLQAPNNYLEVQQEDGICVRDKEIERETSSRRLLDPGNGQDRFAASTVDLSNHQHRYQQSELSSISTPFEHQFLLDNSAESSARQTLRSKWLMEATKQQDLLAADDIRKGGDVVDTDQVVTSSKQNGQSGASMIREKRPDHLMRLASTRTDDTARPSPPSTSSLPSTAGPTPAATADNAFGKARDPMDNAVVTKYGHGQLASSHQDGSDDLAEQITQALNIDMPTSPSSDDLDGIQELSNRRGRIASPDSWRSLLPDDDPYFIPNGTLSTGTSSRAASIAGPTSAEGRLAFQEHASSGGVFGGMTMAASPSDKEGRRLSSDSLLSSFSLAGPTAASLYASSNASGSTHDMDSTHNIGGSRAAFAPLQYQYSHNSKGLASPLLQHAKERDFVRSNSIDERQEDRMSKDHEAAYRRHASFSTFDTPSSTQGNVVYPISPTAYSPLIHPDHRNRSKVYNTHSGHAVSPEKQAVKYSALSNVTIPSSPASSCAMGNEGDRESWPSSRTSLQGWQADVANTAGPRNIVQVLDPYSVNKKLVDGLQLSNGSVESAPSVLAMSSKTIESDAPGLPADHRLLTTTTLTTLASTTTTLVASPPASNSLPMQMESSKEHYTPENSAYDIGPLPPAAVPFLESRTAPASTELKVETHPTHYTLKTKLPGYDLNGITLATKHQRELVIIADAYDERDGGHFERRVTFGTDADLRATKAIFDGTLLKITVPRVS